MRFSAIALFLIVLVPACAREHTDIVGPYSGVTYRFTVDALVLPQARADFADDLDGDGDGDDQLGTIAGTLAADHALTEGIDDMLGSGVLAPVIEITTDDPELRDDPTVGVRILGRDGAVADELGARLVGGVLTSNRTATLRQAAAATLALPLFADADPVSLPAIGVELELQPDPTGFSGVLHGAFPVEALTQPAYAGFHQMIAARPTRYAWLVSAIDDDGDGEITFDEFARDSILLNLMAPDVDLRDGDGNFAPSREGLQKDALSFGLGLHLVACATGSCHAAPADPCLDRVRDGDETDVDCGGSCALACPGGARCGGDGDCQTGRCAAGVCAASSCSDGVRDGHELGVDCGNGCAPCAGGALCAKNDDCASGICYFGECAPPTCANGSADAGETGVDCGGPCPPCG